MKPTSQRVGPEKCKGDLCGHCRSCGRYLDNHDGLSIPAAPVACPKDIPA